MKYLKLYESIKEYSLEDYLQEYFGYDIQTIQNIQNFNCSGRNLTSLKIIENMTNLIYFYCENNKLTNLNGIENCVNLKILEANWNLLNDVKSLTNLTNLVRLSLTSNQLEDVSYLVNLVNLKGLYLKHNKLTNIDFVKHLNKLEGLSSIDNDWDYPFPTEWIRKFNLVYSDYVEIKFNSYEYQKEVLEEHPEKAKRLEGFFIPKIIEEYKELLDFFNINY